MNSDALPQSCPFEDCRRHFAVPSEQHGRAIRCPGCGRSLTAMPPALLRQHAAERLRLELARQGRSAPGGPPDTPVAGVTGASGVAGGSTHTGGDPDFVALLENIRSLWNVGSMFRTADGAGIGRLVLAGITGCPPRPEIAKTALGADESVPWEAAPDALVAAARLRAGGYRLVALETGDDSVPLDEVDAGGRLCLIVGHEVAGISRDLCMLADTRAALPMRGVKTSLNVAVAFGVAAYALAAARHRSARRDASAGCAEPPPAGAGKARQHLELPAEDG